MAKNREIEKYKRALGIAMDALEMYADPSTYHAIAFLFDRPCGGFANDFSRVKESDYNRPMPGKEARAALQKLSSRYGNIAYYGHNEISA